LREASSIRSDHVWSGSHTAVKENFQTEIIHQSFVLFDLCSI